MKPFTPEATMTALWAVIFTLVAIGLLLLAGTIW